MLAQMPVGAHSVRLLTAGHWGLADWIDAWIERCAASGRPVTGLDLTCWTTSADVASKVGDWLGRFDGRVRLVIDSFMLVRNKTKRGDTPFERLVEVLGAERWRAGVTHWKGARLVGADVVLVSTGNLETARRVEVMIADRDPAWAAEVGRWFDAAFTYVKPYELVPKEDEARKRLRTRANSDLWRAFDLAASARVAELQGIPLSVPVTETDMPGAPDPAAGAASGPPPEDAGPPMTPVQLMRLACSRIQARLRGNAAIGTSEMGDMVQQLREAADVLGAAEAADLRIAGEVCDVLEEALVPRALAERRAVALAGLERIGGGA